MYNILLLFCTEKTQEMRVKAFKGGVKEKGCIFF